LKNSIIIIISVSITVVVLGIIASVLLSNQSHVQNIITNKPPVNLVQVSISDLKKFNSTDDLQKFLINSQVRSTPYDLPIHGGMIQSGRIPVGRGEMTMSAPAIAPNTDTNIPPSSSGGKQYSTTNIQVAGIDEPDILKNDGKYAYILSQDKLTIIDAYPGDTAKIISKVGLDVKGDNLQNMFLNKNRLVIFYNDNRQSYAIPKYDYIPNPVYAPVTHAVIIDVSDKENPHILKNYDVTGYYTGARMIGDYVYFISNSYVDYIHPMPPILRKSESIVVTPDVYYFGNPEINYNFDTITSFNIFSNEINSKTFMIGSTGTLYVSNDAIYLTYQKYQPYYNDETYNKDRFFTAIVPLLTPDVQSQINSIQSNDIDPSQKWTQISDLLQNAYNKMSDNDKNKLFDKIQQAASEYDIRIHQEYRKTVIQKFSIDNGTVSYVAQGQVPGYLLNQYSMDEYKDKFRVTTTTEYFTSKGVTTANNVYVLNNSLHILGGLEKVAPEESIYSARFMGDKLYLVTYQRMDPFFVIDLSVDIPKVLGVLRIPGYSRYLHPYDDTHIIGIGKETMQNQYGGLQPLGVKIALFDVSDMSNPITIDTYLIGTDGADSEILSDPKAFLFDKEKNLLSIPISSQYYGQPIPIASQGISDSGKSVDVMPPRPILPNNWKGFYVFGVNTSKGFSLKGIVEHYNGTTYDYGYGSRSFYIDDSLYTVTSGFMKINDLNDMKHEVNSIKIGDTGQIFKYLN
jgi:inhibitor of cysteine peptidase